MKFILILLFTIIPVEILSAQKIDIKKESWGYKLTQGETILKNSDYQELIEPNTLSYQSYNKFKRRKGFANFLTGLGGLIIATQIPSLLRKEDVKPWRFVIGAGLVGFSMPIRSNANSNKKFSVEQYNEQF